MLQKEVKYRVILLVLLALTLLTYPIRAMHTCGDLICGAGELCPADCNKNISCSICNKICPVQPLKMITQEPTISYESVANDSVTKLNVGPGSTLTTITQNRERGFVDPALVAQQQTINEELALLAKRQQELQDRLASIDHRLTFGQENITQEGGIDSRDNPPPLLKVTPQTNPTIVTPSATEPRVTSVITRRMTLIREQYITLPAITSFLLILLTAALLAVIYHWFKQRKEALAGIAFMGSLFDVAAIKVKSMITIEIPTIPDHFTVKQALGAHETSELSSYFLTTERQYKGTVTARTLLAHIIQNIHPEQIPVIKCVETPAITLDADATLLQAVDAISKHNADILPVIRRGEIMGGLTATSLLERFSSITRLMGDTRNVPTLREIMLANPPKTLTTTPVLETIRELVTKGSSCILIADGTTIQGSATEQSILREIMKNPDLLEHGSANAIISSDSTTLTPGTTILEACTVFIRTNTSAHVIRGTDSVVGIVRRCDILRALLQFSSDHQRK